MEVVGRELINDVGRGRSSRPGVSFHGRHDFWREFGRRMGLRGSKLVGIQFTVQKPSPRRLFNPRKIAKTNLFS